MSEQREPYGDEAGSGEGGGEGEGGGKGRSGEGHRSGDGNGGGNGGGNGEGEGGANGAGGPARGPGSHARPLTAGHAWRTFLNSRFRPACVITLLIAAAAGLFASSYTWALADPAPRQVPTAVVGSASQPHKARAFVAALEKSLGSSLKLHPYRTNAQAERAVEAQRVFAVLRARTPDSIEMNVASASGASVAELLEKSGPKVAKAVGVQVRIRDLKPLSRGDPRGLVIFYISLAAVIIGFLGAIQLSINVSELAPAELIAFVLLYSLAGGLVIVMMVDWLLASVRLPFFPSWGILSLTMFTSGMVFTMFNSLFGRWAVAPTWGLMVVLGNPSSGGAVSWPLLPAVLGAIGHWLPPGASVNAQHTAVYFPGYQHLQPYLVLAGWALVSSTVYWNLRHRQRGGRSNGPAHADT